MADPQHQEALDAHDVRTVWLYRVGIGVSAGALLAVAVALGSGTPLRTAAVAQLLGVGLMVANLHLYAKAIRWVIAMSGWTGAVLLASGAGGLVEAAALGFLWIAVSAIALKERLCFRLPGLAFVPWLLASAVAFHAVGADQVAGGLVAVAAPIVALLAWAKIRQPTHFDVGDKARYEV
jgi:uncharacterized integral membrane protein